MVLESARSERNVPKIKIIASDVNFICVRISKAGYFGGDPSKVRQATIDDVFRILEYENFLSDYEFTEYKLNEK